MITIYFDVCCLNRPFDDQTQDRIHLGAVGMIRFLQQFRTGDGDYSKDRHAWLDQETDVYSLAQKIIAQRSAP